jgi:FkbM family methyltransferase
MAYNYEDMLEQVYSKIVQEGDQAIDIGAHSGRHAKPLCALVGDTGKVIALEPIPYVREWLKGYTHEYKNRITILPYAMGNKRGTLSFTIAKDRPEESGFKERDYNGPTELERILVEVSKVDKLRQVKSNLRFIKIDTEGAEFQVLLGAEETLKKLKPVVAFEFGEASYSAYNVDPAKVYQYMNGLRYTMYSITGDKLNEAEFVKASIDQNYWDYIACYESDCAKLEEAFKSCSLKTMD